MSRFSHFLLLSLVHNSISIELIFHDTLSNDTYFDHSADTAQFITDSQLCRADGDDCVELSATSPASYLQTTSGAISTVGYTNIQIEVQCSLASWVSGSILSVYWIPDASIANPDIIPITTYDHDDLTQNKLLTLSYDLSTTNNTQSPDNRANFALGFQAYFSGNGEPTVYIDSISISGTVNPDTPTSAPTKEPTAEPTSSPTTNPTTSSDQIIVTDGGQHGEATHVSAETTNSALFTNHGDINHHGAIYAGVGMTFAVGLVIAMCVMMYKLHQKQVRSRGSSEGRVRPGIKSLRGPKMLRINTEGTMNEENDGNVLLQQDGNGNQSPNGPVSPDGYGGTGTANEGGDILVDDHQNIEIVDSDNELDEVDNDIEIVLRGSTVDGSKGDLLRISTVDGSKGHLDDDVVHDIDALVDDIGGQTMGTAVGERLLSQPGGIEDLNNERESAEEFEIVEDVTVGADQ